MARFVETAVWSVALGGLWLLTAPSLSIQEVLAGIVLSLFVLMLFNPIAMACAYAALGMVVGLSHVIFPKPGENSWKVDMAAEDNQYAPELMAA